jgi:hypothetical protein
MSALYTPSKSSKPLIFMSMEIGMGNDTDGLGSKKDEIINSLA